MSVNVGQAISFKVDTSAAVPPRHPAPGLLRRRRRAARSPPACRSRARRPAGVPDRAGDRARRLRQLGRLGLLDGAQHRGLRRLRRPPRAQRHRRRQPDPVRRARRLEPLRRRPADLRRDLAGLQQLRRQQPLQVHGLVPGRQPAGLQGRVRGVLQPPVGRIRSRPTAATPTSGTPSTRWCASSRRTATTSSYVAQADLDQNPALLQEPQGLPLQRPRRVLVGRRAQRGGVRARRGRQPRLLQRQRGVLEDALDELHRQLQHSLPHAGLL